MLLNQPDPLLSSTLRHPDCDNGAALLPIATFGCVNNASNCVNHADVINYTHNANPRTRSIAVQLFEDDPRAEQERDGLDLVRTVLLGGFGIVAMVAIFGGSI